MVVVSRRKRRKRREIVAREDNWTTPATREPPDPDDGQTRETRPDLYWPELSAEEKARLEARHGEVEEDGLPRTWLRRTTHACKRCRRLYVLAGGARRGAVVCMGLHAIKEEDGERRAYLGCRACGYRWTLPAS